MGKDGIKTLHPCRIYQHSHSNSIDFKAKVPLNLSIFRTGRGEKKLYHAHALCFTYLPAI